MAGETKLLREIQLYATTLGWRLFRNQVGRYMTPDGRWVSYGLGGPGGADLIGWMPMEIEGQRVAVFTAVEVKAPRGRVSGAQQNFISQVSASGGIGIVARDLEDIKKPGGYPGLKQIS
jgi:hypothetical protein